MTAKKKSKTNTKIQKKCGELSATSVTNTSLFLLLPFSPSQSSKRLRQTPDPKLYLLIEALLSLLCYKGNII